jgi:hypothetical protein
MPGAEIALRAPTPGTDESEIERAANHRARYGNQTAYPFFRGFFAEFCGQPLGDSRRKLLEHLFFGEVFAEVDARGGRGGQPELALLVFAVGFEAVQQSQALNQAQGNDGEQAQIGNEA